MRVTIAVADPRIAAGLVALLAMEGRFDAVRLGATDPIPASTSGVTVIDALALRGRNVPFEGPAVVLVSDDAERAPLEASAPNARAWVSIRSTGEDLIAAIDRAAAPVAPPTPAPVAPPPTARPVPPLPTATSVQWPPRATAVETRPTATAVAVTPAAIPVAPPPAPASAAIGPRTAAAPAPEMDRAEPSAAEVDPSAVVPAAPAPERLGAVRLAVQLTGTVALVSAMAGVVWLALG
jgi:hypothetical protein